MTSQGPVQTGSSRRDGSDGRRAPERSAPSGPGERNRLARRVRQASGAQHAPGVEHHARASRIGPVAASTAEHDPARGGTVRLANEELEADCYAACADRVLEFVRACRRRGIDDSEINRRLARIASDLRGLLFSCGGGGASDRARSSFSSPRSE